MRSQQARSKLLPDDALSEGHAIDAALLPDEVPGSEQATDAALLPLCALGEEQAIARLHSQVRRYAKSNLWS